MTNTQPTTINEPEPIYVFDTTLRDGEQAPGNTMFDKDKLEIASELTEAKVDIIEAGFPGTSEGDLASVDYVATELLAKYGYKMPVIAGLARAIPGDIEAAAKALKTVIGIGKGRIHTFIGTSDPHINYKLRKTQEQILEMAVNAVKLARNYTDDVEFSPEDASRTGIEFLLEIAEAVAKAGAKTINIPDTVGYGVPEKYGAMVGKVVEMLRPYRVVVSTHCHNDLGLAVANTLAALINGARQAEVAINGIGERAGNASLEEVVMGIKTVRDYYTVEKRIFVDFDTPRIGKLSLMVSRVTGSAPSKNKSVVGENAFSHQAGIHQDGMEKNENTYEIMKPEDVGWMGEKYVAGKHSGRAGVGKVLEQIGYDEVKDEMIDRIKLEIKDLAIKQKHIFDDDIRKIADSYGLKPRREIIELDMENVVYTKVVNPAVRTPITWGEVEEIVKGQGNGPVHAAYSSIKERVGNGIELLSFRINAVGSGESAMAEARVIIERKGKTYVARGGHSDIVVAAISAYVNAINRSIVDE